LYSLDMMLLNQGFAALLSGTFASPQSGSPKACGSPASSTTGWHSATCSVR
jgi:hypothetical protein